MSKLDASWAGVRFAAVGPRDGRMFRAPGLFGFARRDSDDDCVLLFVGHADLLSVAAGPSHAAWADALVLGFNELHVHGAAVQRVDRLQLCDRIIRRVHPILNVTDAEDERRRRVG